MMKRFKFYIIFCLLTVFSIQGIALQCSDLLTNNDTMFTPLAAQNNEFLDKKIRDYFHDRTGGFGRGDAAVEHHFLSLLEISGGSNIALARAVTRSLKWTANEIIGAGSSNWFMRNHYQIGYNGWVISAKMMLEKIKLELSDSDERMEVNRMITYIDSELNYTNVTNLRSQ